MFGMYYGREKLTLFVIGILVTAVSLIGLAFNFGYTPGIIGKFPADPRIYFGITAILGIIALVSSLTRSNNRFF